MRLVSLLLLAAFIAACAPDSPVAELKAERDPAKRSIKALTLADTAYDQARDYYGKGEVKKGDEQLEHMTLALNECVGSLEEARKAGLYKRAELNVAGLLKRIRGLVSEVNAEDRGWVEFTQRKLEEIHDKLLVGVMRK